MLNNKMSSQKNSQYTMNGVLAVGKLEFATIREGANDVEGI